MGIRYGGVKTERGQRAAMAFSLLVRGTTTGRKTPALGERGDRSVADPLAPKVARSVRPNPGSARQSRAPWTPSRAGSRVTLGHGRLVQFAEHPLQACTWRCRPLNRPSSLGERVPANVAHCDRRHHRRHRARRAHGASASHRRLAASLTRWARVPIEDRSPARRNACRGERSVRARLSSVAVSDGVRDVYPSGCGGWAIVCTIRLNSLAAAGVRSARSSTSA